MRPGTPEKRLVKSMGLQIDSAITVNGPTADWVQRKIQLNDDVRVIGFDIQLDIYVEGGEMAWALGYQSAHCWMGTTPMTEHEGDAAIVPNGQMLEAQCLVHCANTTAPNSYYGNDTDHTNVVFPDEMGVDVDKNDYIYVSLLHILKFLDSAKVAGALARCRIWYAER